MLNLEVYNLKFYILQWRVRLSLKKNFLKYSPRKVPKLFTSKGPLKEKVVSALCMKLKEFQTTRNLQPKFLKINPLAMTWMNACLCSRYLITLYLEQLNASLILMTRLTHS